jgi:hypothetical protein
MTGWTYIIIGVFFVALGTVSIGYGWHILGRSSSPATSNAEQAVNIRSSSIGGDVVLGDKSTISQTSDEELIEWRKATVKIKRAFEDFDRYLSILLEEHHKDIDGIAQRHNFHGTYSSGPHLKEQYELARKKRRDISTAWLELKRKVEDELLGSGQAELSDADLKNQYARAEEAKDQAQQEVLDATHNYFTSRSATFSLVDLDRLKQAVLNDEPL